METLHLVYRDYESSVGIERVRLSRTLTVLLIYTAIPPGRGREYREMLLQLHDGPADILVGVAPTKTINILHYNKLHRSGVMHIADHKTSKSRPPQTIQCPSTPLFVEVLDDYICKYREQLIPPTVKTDYLILVSKSILFVVILGV